MWTFPALEPVIVERGDFVLQRTLDRPGEVIVRVGDRVTPESVIARSERTERQVSLYVANELGVPADSMDRYLTRKVGASFRAGEEVARRRSGLRNVSVSAPLSGVLTAIDVEHGTVTLNVTDEPVPLRSVVSGDLELIVQDRGAIIRAAGARIFGIAGFGDEAVGPLTIAVDRPERELTAQQVRDEWRGAIVVCGMTVGVPTLQRLRDVGVHGIIVGSIAEADIRRFLSADAHGEATPVSFWLSSNQHDVLAPGAAPAPFAVMLTEGFGRIPMAEPVFAFLQRHAAHQASLLAHTSLGSSLRRPEMYVSGRAEGSGERPDVTLRDGRMVRTIASGHPGVVGTCRSEVYTLTSDDGARREVVQVELPSGSVQAIPVTNIEVLE